MSKDQAIGITIFAVCVVIAVTYLATLFFPEWLGILGLDMASADVRFWVVALPVFIAFIAILGIGAWIGWTMATTPPPKPIEELKSETKEESEGGQEESQK